MPKKKPTNTNSSQLADLQSRLARALADYSNLEKRFERDSSSIVKFANSSLLGKLLEIRDHLEAASAHSQDKSLSMILSSLDKILDEENVKKIDTKGVFDPVTMECQETVPGDKDKIISVARSGYTLHGRLLRPSRVVVGNGQTK